MINKDFFDTVRAKVPIFDTIRQHVILEIQEKNQLYWVGKSPFYDNNNSPKPVAHIKVNPHTNTYYCCGEDEGGDVIDFISKIKECSQFEAAKHLAKKYNRQVKLLELAEDPASEQHQEIETPKTPKPKPKRKK